MSAGEIRNSRTIKAKGYFYYSPIYIQRNSHFIDVKKYRVKCYLERYTVERKRGKSAGRSQRTDHKELRNTDNRIILIVLVYSREEEEILGVCLQ